MSDRKHPSANLSMRGRITMEIQSRNPHLDMPTARYYVDAVLDTYAKLLTGVLDNICKPIGINSNEKRQQETQALGQ